MNKYLYFILIGIILIGASLFQVDERECAIVFQFGEAVKSHNSPGLKFKLPFIQSVNFYDKRVLSVNAEAKEVIASDQKRLIVDAFARYKIVDPILFFKTVNNMEGARVRLNSIIEAALRRTIGQVSLASLLSVERSKIMGQIEEFANTQAKKLGLDIIDVRILRSDLPKENSSAIYKRMQTDREKEAKEIRAEGEEEAERIKAKADRERRIILVEAYKQSEIMRGEGEAEASGIFNEAFSKDPEFYNIYRSLTVYVNALKGENTNYILSPDSEFFKYLKLKN